MKIVVSCDSFKGSLSSREACEAVAKGALRANAGFTVVCVPIADGGEGTVDAFRAVGNCVSHVITVSGAYGERLEAEYLMCGKTAIIESAQANGITRTERRDCENASTYGVGELISDALDNGAEKLVIGLGGSATSDCGIGALAALGAVFKDERGNKIKPSLSGLCSLCEIDISGLDKRFMHTETVLACDVTNPLCGKNGAVYVYGGQKGIADADMPRYDKAFMRYAAMVKSITGKDVNDTPGCGAAGGLAAGLFAFGNCKIQSGVKCLLENIGYAKIVADADVIVSGEGKIDAQTMCGKAVTGVAAYASGKKLILFAGCVDEGCDKLYSLGVTGIFCIQQNAVTFDEAMKNAYRNLSVCSENVFRVI